MESTRAGIATKAPVPRDSEPFVAMYDLLPSLLHRALPVGRDVCSHWRYFLGIAIADRACFHAPPQHTEQKEKVNLRRGFSPTRCTAPMLHLVVVAVFL